MSPWCLPCPLSFSGWCAGARILRPVICSACSDCPFVSGVFWSVCFLCGVFMVLRVPVGLWLLLLSLPRLLCSSLLLVCGVASAWLALSLLRSPPALPAPSASPLVPSGPVSVLLVPPSWVSGCICNGPVVMPVAWCVVTAWHLSSLLLMATKASALCGALPSTPCCECCSGALPSCTEVFTLG